MTSEPDTKTQIAHELSQNVLRIVEYGTSFAKPNSCKMLIDIEQMGADDIDALKNVAKTGEIVKQSLLSIGGLEVLTSPSGYEPHSHSMKCGCNFGDYDFEQDDECEDGDEDYDFEQDDEYDDGEDNEYEDEDEDNEYDDEDSTPIAMQKLVVKLEDITSIPAVISKMVEIGNISIDYIDLNISDELKQKEAEKAIKDAYDRAKANSQIISRETGLTLKEPKKIDIEIDYDPYYGPDNNFKCRYPEEELHSLLYYATSCDDILTSVLGSFKIVTVARVELTYEYFDEKSD